MKTILNRHYGGIICILAGVLWSTGVNASSQDDLSDALTKYCVPKCTSGCRSSFQAAYDEATDTCKCAGDGIILVYEESSRECVLKCPAGSGYIATAKCAAGMKKNILNPVVKQ